jgi:hypothetical protein
MICEITTGFEAQMNEMINQLVAAAPKAALKDPNNRPPRSYLCEFDFIAYDFLYSIRPEPHTFELKQALQISDIEQRHDYMISVILDRIRNQSKYEQEHYGKISKYHEYRTKYENSKKLFEGTTSGKWYKPTRSIRNAGKDDPNHSLRMEGCKHEDTMKDTLYHNGCIKSEVSEDGPLWRPYRRRSTYWLSKHSEAVYLEAHWRYEAVKSLAKKAGKDYLTFLSEKGISRDYLENDGHVALYDYYNEDRKRMNEYLMSDEVTNEMIAQHPDLDKQLQLKSLVKRK